MQTHIANKAAKALKEFMGESAPEPMGDNPMAYYGKDFMHYAPEQKFSFIHEQVFSGFAYQLHDLLSRPFCEAMAKKTKWKHELWGRNCEPIDVYARVAYFFYEGGLPAVEAALCKMMEAK